MDRHRSRDLYIDGSKAHSFLLKLCIQTLTDFHGGSTQERTAVALQYSRNFWVTHYNYSDKLDPGALDKVLEEYDPEMLLPLAYSTSVNALISWWNNFALLQDHLHSRVSVLFTWFNS